MLRQPQQTATVIRLGLDIDDTITADPQFFKQLASKVIACGGEVHLVTSKSPDARADTLKTISKYGIEITTLYFIPSFSMAQSLCPHQNLDWYKKYLWGKASYAIENGLTHFVDEDMKVRDLFTQYASGVIFVPLSVARLYFADACV